MKINLHTTIKKKNKYWPFFLFYIKNYLDLKLLQLLISNNKITIKNLFLDFYCHFKFSFL
jgi:hypothetical protein